MLRKESMEFCHHSCMQMHLNIYHPENLKTSSVTVLNSENTQTQTLRYFSFSQTNSLEVVALILAHPVVRCVNLHWSQLLLFWLVFVSASSS